MFFNKRELITTYDFKKQALIREALANSKIEYYINPVLMSPSINRAAAEYKIYVKKSDYDTALHIINKLGWCAKPERNGAIMHKIFTDKIKYFTVIYIILTIIKFFTVSINTVREEDPTIYFKFYPTIENSVKPVIDPGELYEYYCNKYSWYAQKQYFEIVHSHGGSFAVLYIYYALIALWWVSSAGLIFYALYILNRKTERRISS